MRVIEKVMVVIDGITIEVERLDNGTFRKPEWLTDALRAKKRVPAAQVRNPKSIQGGHGVDGGDRPWMEKARAVGFHEVDDETPVTDPATTWNGWGTALKPAWEPVVIGHKP